MAQSAMDSLPETQKRKFPLRLRAGADLFRLVKSQVDPDYQGLELVGDLQITEKLYIAAELGTEQRTQTAENTSFTSTGNYIRVGMDLDLYKNWKGMENNIFLGVLFQQLTPTAGEPLQPVCSTPLLARTPDPRWLCYRRKRRSEYELVGIFSRNKSSTLPEYLCLF